MKLSRDDFAGPKHILSTKWWGFFLYGKAKVFDQNMFVGFSQRTNEKNQPRNVDVSVQKLAEFSRSQKTISCQYKKRAKPLICLWVNKNPVALECFVCGEGENSGRQ